jgi:hypothetical protein
VVSEDAGLSEQGFPRIGGGDTTLEQASPKHEN